MPAARAPRALLSALLSLVLLSSATAGRAGAADPPSLQGPAPFETRSGQPKGSGSAPDALTTGRLIVQYRVGASHAVRAAARAAIGATLVGSVSRPDTELLEAPAGVEQAVATLEHRSDVVSATPEYRRRLFAGPTTEPFFGEQWGLHNTGQTVAGFPGVRDVDMNVPEAWNVTTGSSDVVVAVIDDGVDLAHPDLVNRAWVNTDEVAGNGLDDDANGYVDDVNGWDFCNDDKTVHDADDNHGTHVAGSIAASGNGAGVAGVAPNVRIMALKFIHGTDDLACGSDSQAIAAIEYAVANGADIINASWGGYGYSQPLADAFADASDLLVVAAAGNDDSDNDLLPAYPASFDLSNILSVASVHNQGHLSGFTNFGPSSVDLSAPGEDILSTLPAGSYGYGSGTSMAAANASGVAALAASAHPSLVGDGAALREHLIRTARALPSTRWWVAHPSMVDARAAVVSVPDVRRLSGADRYATSAAISAANFVPQVPYLFVATGDNFPDALSGGALAAQLGVPLLLVKRTSVPSVVMAEIQRLDPFHIFVLGGTGAVANGVLSLLAPHDNPSSGGPFRLAGVDRYDTAAVISEAGFENGWGGTVFIANGGNFPDALAGGAASAVVGGPVLLTRSTSLPAPTKTELLRLQPSRVVILGGVGVVSSAVANALKGYAAGGNVVRWSGPDRYATSAATSSNAFPTAGSVFLAAGTTFPDALSGDPSAGAFAAPLLLTARTTLPGAAKAELQRLDPVRVFILGGTAAVAESVVNEVKALFP